MATTTVAARLGAARRLTRIRHHHFAPRPSAPPPPSSDVVSIISRDFSSLSLLGSSSRRSAATSSASAAATASAAASQHVRRTLVVGPASAARDAPYLSEVQCCGSRYTFDFDIGGQTRAFSTPPRVATDDDEAAAAADANDDPNVLAWPRNLTISRDATSSPFYGLEKVQDGEMVEVDMEEEEEGEGEDDGEEEAAAAAAAEDEDDDEDEYDSGEWDDNEEDDDDEEEELYDLTTRPEPYRAIPLPDRLHVPVYQLDHKYPLKQEVGTIHLDPLIFGLDPIRVDLIHKVVRYQRNKKRGKRYPAKTKTISEVRGSGRKVRQQKGLGRARAGHRRPAHWRGGAKAHGPKGVAQDYTTRLNKKVRKLGLRHALSQKLKEGNVIVTSDLRSSSHKTKHLEHNLKKLGIAGRKSPAFILDDAKDDIDDDDDGEIDEENIKSVGGVDINFKVASGNIRRVRVVNQLGANVYDILRHEKLVMSLAAVSALEERLMP